MAVFAGGWHRRDIENGDSHRYSILPQSLGPGCLAVCFDFRVRPPRPPGRWLRIAGGGRRVNRDVAARGDGPAHATAHGHSPPVSVEVPAIGNAHPNARACPDRMREGTRKTHHAGPLHPLGQARARTNPSTRWRHGRTPQPPPPAQGPRRGSVPNASPTARIRERLGGGRGGEQRSWRGGRSTFS